MRGRDELLSFDAVRYITGVIDAAAKVAEACATGRAARDEGESEVLATRDFGEGCGGDFVRGVCCRGCRYQGRGEGELADKTLHEGEDKVIILGFNKGFLEMVVPKVLS